MHQSLAWITWSVQGRLYQPKPAKTNTNSPVSASNPNSCGFSLSDLYLNATVEIDSRLLKPGSIYVARKGKQTNGHDFIEAAIKNGAKLIILDDPYYLPGNYRCISSPQSSPNFPHLGQDLELKSSQVAKLDNLTDKTKSSTPANPRQYFNSSKPQEPEGCAKEVPLCLLVEDSTVALQRLARSYLNYLRLVSSITVIGITGSVGKTTTKDMLAQVLGHVDQVVFAEKSYNNETGLPLTVLKANQHTRYLVLEMGASHPGDLELLVDIAPLDVACLLNIGHSHLGNFPTKTTLIKEKFSIALGLKPRGTLVVNLDDRNISDNLSYLNFTRINSTASKITPKSNEENKITKTIDYTPNNLKQTGGAQTNRIQIFGYGIKDQLKPNLQAKQIVLDELARASFEVSTSPYLQAPGEQNLADQTKNYHDRCLGNSQGDARTYPIKLSVPGHHQVYNALATLSVVKVLDLDFGNALRVLGKFTFTSPHRLQITEVEQWRNISNLTLIDDTYNASLESIKAGFQVAEKLKTDRRLVFILADILELGNNSQVIHDEIAKLVSRYNPQLLIYLGENLAYDNYYLKSVSNRFFVKEVEEIEDLLQEKLNSHDLIYLKGSNAMGLDKLLSLF